MARHTPDGLPEILLADIGGATAGDAATVEFTVFPRSV